MFSGWLLGSCYAVAKVFQVVATELGYVVKRELCGC